MTAGRLADKVVVITGGTSGIGRSSSHLFGQEGARVVVGARNEAAGEQVVGQINAKGGDALFVKTDVAHPDEVQHLVDTAMDRFGRIDVLYGNSGIFPAGSAPDTTIEMWRECIDVNLGGQFYLAKYGIPALIESGGNAIIFTASELGTVGMTEAVALWHTRELPGAWAGRNAAAAGLDQRIAAASRDRRGPNQARPAQTLWPGR